MSTKYFRDAGGNFLGGFSGYQPPAIQVINEESGEPELIEQDYVYPDIPTGAIEVPNAPEHALDKWSGNAWVKPNSLKVEELKEQLATMEREAILARGDREEKLMALPLLVLLLSSLTTQQKTAMAAIEAQLYAGNPSFKNAKDTDVLATSIRAQIKALST